ncbi:TOBE domain-containing protein [Natrialba aegyptia]|uniref:TOBE domain-containing protein n=1 Tax=Natrialba aegyptia DSM 13077 TaxID=1227491 RepID=M0B2P7_9EURY|nr:TOBE domain-containing protein [Natrialba aegyptia]ELZ04488.1 TOBE domain-containing protein [Natrialba aegyptia DSM 13077]
MTVEKRYRTELAIDGVTIDRRDVEMLEAIDRHGSMHAAADALGRSYARLQRRIVELEDAVGAVTERRRGGADGGGTELTPAAVDLLQQFERHQTELDGVARVTESVFPGALVDRTGELGTVETPIGRIVALVPDDATTVEVGVRSDAVVLSDPSTVDATATDDPLASDASTADSDATDGSDPRRTSLRNQFTGTVTAIDAADAIARVTLDLGDEGDKGNEGNEDDEGDDSGDGDSGDEFTLQTVITRTSLQRLELEPGVAVRASFKATAARAIPAAQNRE